MTASAGSSLGCESVEQAVDPDVEEAGERGLFNSVWLEALYRRHAARLLRRFERSIGHENAGEVVNEAFARLAEGSADRNREIVSPEAFVTTVATNVLRDRARAAARQALRQQEMASADEVAPDPHRLLESREALHAIESALACMSPRRRRIFLLHRFENMTYAQVGMEVGMSEKGVKKQIAKALAELRLAIGDAL